MVNLSDVVGTLAANAIRYADNGLEIFPANPGDKKPLTSQYDATVDITAIDAWWRTWPRALIAHRLPPDVIVLDIDPRHGGLDTWRALMAEHDNPTIVTRYHISGRGDNGGHLWFPRPADKLNISGVDAWAREHGTGHAIVDANGEEIRWTGGIDLLQRDHRYTILPPSPHPDTGQPYRWRYGLDVEPAPMPGWLADLLTDDAPPPPPRPPAAPRDPDSIADWYTQTHPFSQLLPSYGWRLIAGDGDEERSRWRHPTATSAFSATIKYGYLFCHSPNTPLEPTAPGSPHGYSPFAVYAAYEHRGDQRAAARAARELKDGPRLPRTDVTEFLIDKTDEGSVDEPVTHLAWQLPSPTIDNFLNDPEPAYDWLIPGLIERGDRIIVTAGEGVGKSTFIRQISIQAAAGIHPFTLDDITPIRVVVLDLENSRRHVRRQMRPLRETADGLDPDRLVISVVPEGIDLMHREGLDALDDLIARVEPDLVAVGPLYKLASGDPKDEEQAQAVRKALDHYRATYDCAFLIEAHQPYATGGSTKRPLRPYGASLWSRWPEFGIALCGEPAAPTVDIKHWRGARDERDWPSVLTRGDEWPWEHASDRDATFATMLDVARDHYSIEGVMPSVRRIVQLLAEQGLTVGKTTVARAITNNQATWDAVAQ